MDLSLLRREGLSLALMGVYGLEAGVVAAGWFGRAGLLIMGTTTLCLLLSVWLARGSRSIWPSLMVASHLIALTCLWLGRPGDAVVLAAWGAAHAPALIAAAQGLLLRAGPRFRLRPAVSARGSGRRTS